MAECKPKNPQVYEELFKNWDTKPEDRTNKWRCPDISWQSSPLALTSILAKIMDQYLHDVTNFTDSDLRRVVTSNDLKVTQLDKVDYKAEGALPRVGINFISSTMSQELFGRNNQTGYNINNSTGSYYTTWTLEHSVTIVAATRRESMLLAEALCKLFSHYKTVIQKMLEAHDFRVTQFQGAQSVSEDGSFGYKSVLGLTTIAPDRWYLTEVSPRLKRVQCSIDER